MTGFFKHQYPLINLLKHNCAQSIRICRIYMNTHQWSPALPLCLLISLNKNPSSPLFLFFLKKSTWMGISGSTRLRKKMNPVSLSSKYPQSFHNINFLAIYFIIRARNLLLCSSLQHQSSKKRIRREIVHWRFHVF